MRIIYINPLFPYPILQGNQMTAMNRLKYLSQFHSITLITLHSEKHGMNINIEYLKPYCDEIITVYHPQWKSIISVILGFFFSKKPFQVLYYNSQKLSSLLRNLRMTKKGFDIVHLNTIRVEQYYKGFFDIPCLIDLHDSMILNIQSRLNKEKGLKQLLYNIELKRIKKYEKEIVKKYKNVMVLAEQDKLIHDNKENIEVIHLGVDETQFKRTNKLPNNKTLVFSGNMSYTPNVDAVIWFLETCWDYIISTVPDAKFKIVGANPSTMLDKYRSMSNVEITGKVDSMVEALNTVQIAIAPLRSSSGMQNKILEAMACGLPVISTSLGLGNIEAQNGKDVFVADSPEEFSKSCIMLLNNYELCDQVGTKATQLIQERYSIKYHCQKLESLYNKIIEEHNHLS